MKLKLEKIGTAVVQKVTCKIRKNRRKCRKNGPFPILKTGRKRLLFLQSKLIASVIITDVIFSNRRTTKFPKF